MMRKYMTIVEQMFSEPLEEAKPVKAMKPLKPGETREDSKVKSDPNYEPETNNGNSNQGNDTAQNGTDVHAQNTDKAEENSEDESADGIKAGEQAKNFLKGKGVIR
jgi:hypothetical protein